MRIRLDCLITVAMTTHIVSRGKNTDFIRISTRTVFFLKNVIFSLNIASNKVRADVAKKNVSGKIEGQSRHDDGCTVFSQKRRWIDLSAGQVYPGEATRFQKYGTREMYHTLINEEDIAIPDIKVIWCCRCHMIADDGSTAHEHFHRLVNIYSYHRTLKLPTTLFRVYVRWSRRL